MVWDCVSSRCHRRLHRRGRNARFVSRFIPAEPRPSLGVMLCLVSIGCIVCMVPVWVPLCMVAGLIFDVPIGSAHNFVALWTGSTLSVMIGRFFFREPIRDSLFDGDALAYRFMWSTSTRTDSWHADSPRRHSCLTAETGTIALFSPWRCLDSVFESEMDISVWLQRQVPWRFWQSPVEVPHIQFIDSVEDIPVWVQRQVPWLFSPVEVPQIQFIDSVEDTPVWQQRQISLRVQFMSHHFLQQVQTHCLPSVMRSAQEIFGGFLQRQVPLVQYIDSIIDVPVVKQRQVRTISTEQRTVKVSQSQQLHRVIVVPVVTLHRHRHCHDECTSENGPRPKHSTQSWFSESRQDKRSLSLSQQTL